MHTLIELFDREPLENAAAPLLFRPEKIVYLGCRDIMRGRQMADLRRFYAAMGLKAEVEFLPVDRYDRDGISRRVLEVLQRNPDCAFDLTGGSELLLVAVGELSRLMGISMHQVNVEKQTVLAIEGPAPEAVNRVDLTVSQNMLLHGGKILSSEDTGWEVTEDFVSSIRTLWSYCRKTPDVFNRHAAFFASAAAVDGLTVKWDAGRGQPEPDAAFLSELRRDGFFTDLERTGKGYLFTYRDKSLKRLFSKAGNLLEVYVYLAALESGVFTDVRQGVTIDWDAEGGSDPTETKNEVDVIAMTGLLPVFLSCKNGTVKKDALYELETVSDRFGGRYAARALVATSVGGGAGDAYLRSRARDSGIVLIEDVNRMELETLSKRITDLL